jgi:hypothetical protein
MTAITKNDISVNSNLWRTANETDTIIKNLLNLSLSSVFAVNINAQTLFPKIIQNTPAHLRQFYKFDPGQLENISLLAYEAVLPGTSFELGQVFGDTQGITEQYPTKKVFAPVDVSFYIDNTYRVLSFFDAWMNVICSSPNPGPNELDVYPPTYNTHFKFNYPETYECYVNIVKFERDLRPSGERVTTGPTSKDKKGGINDPKTYTYTLINAYPTNMISVPVSYEQSNILKTTITFNYDRIYMQQNQGKPYIRR